MKPSSRLFDSVHERGLHTFSICAADKMLPGAKRVLWFSSLCNSITLFSAAGATPYREGSAEELSRHRRSVVPISRFPFR